MYFMGGGGSPTACSRLDLNISHSQDLGCRGQAVRPSCPIGSALPFDACAEPAGRLWPEYAMGQHSWEELLRGKNVGIKLPGSSVSQTGSSALNEFEGQRGICKGQERSLAQDRQKESRTCFESRVQADGQGSRKAQAVVQITWCSCLVLRPVPLSWAPAPHFPPAALTPSCFLLSASCPAFPQLPRTAAPAPQWLPQSLPRPPRPSPRGWAMHSKGWVSAPCTPRATKDKQLVALPS